MSSRIVHLALVGFTIALGPTVAVRSAAYQFVRPNANITPAGVLHGGVLSVSLVAKPSLWYINGHNHPAESFAAFAEPGKAPLMPGPLVLAAAGTEIHLSVHNALSKPLIVYIPAAIRGGDEAAFDSTVIAPDATGLLQSKAVVPGNYVYRASLPGFGRHRGTSGLLAGALVIDTAGAPARPHDRVIVIMETADSAFETCADTASGNAFGECLAVPIKQNISCASTCPIGRGVNTMNGQAWPNTERIRATVGDSLHWRVINASADVHPMHLHGFYYRVDAFSGPLAEVQGRPAPGQMVVTQLLTPWSGMSMTWSPSRPGNWLFHCHFAMHNTPDSISAMPDDPHERMMTGLVLGTIVTERPGVVVAGEPAAKRHIRLVAVEDSDSAITRGRAVVPSMHFVFEEGARRVDAGVNFSPEIDLVRGEPVAITIVNHMAEPTSVHWHGIEIQDSYVDGVPGFSGSGTHLSPAIAPGDSFIARFTPPRAGTFMYHAHVDEVREQVGGLEGALIVRDSGASPDRDDFTFFLKESRLVSLSGPAPRPALPEINGQAAPDTIVLHVGEPARLRLLNLGARQAVTVPVFRLATLWGRGRDVADTTELQWQPIAKDGFDLPASARAVRAASQIVSMGETYDFEFTPERRGVMRLEVVTFVAPGSPAKHKLLVAVPIRVE